MVDKWAEANPDKRKVVTARSREKNREAMRKAQREYHQRNPDRHRNNFLKRTFGITVDEYREMIAKRNGLCDICKSPEPGGKGNFHLDHDHTTGEIRGILCAKCNLGIGSLQDSIEILEAAANYLAKFENVLEVKNNG